MHPNQRRAAVRIGMVVMLVFLASFPITIQYLPPLSKPGLGLGQITLMQDFGSAPEQDVSPAALLAYGDLATQPIVRQGNYTEAQRILATINNLPPNTEYNLKTYIALLHELVSILDSARQGLDQLQKAVTEGKVDVANEKASELEGVLADSSSRLDSLRAALERIADYYWPIDVSGQQAQLEDLSNTLQGYEQLLAKLKDLLTPMDRRSTTYLELWASPNPVWVQGTLHILAKLTGTDGALANRVVDVWINDTATTLTMNRTGEANWDYTVPSSKRMNGVELYARFTPTGKDSSIYRPASSANQTIPVEYYPTMLTLVSPSNRVHVLENFTVQAKLAEASGRALAEESVELLSDDKLVGSCTTNMAGSCSIVGSFPSRTTEGSHRLYARFEPEQGLYASALSQKMGIELYYMKATVSLVAVKGAVQLSGDSLAISGQTVYVESRLEVDSKPFAEGLIAAFLGERELARALSGSDGILRMTVSIPLDITGDQILTLVPVATEQWITGTGASVILKIVNSPVVFLGFGAIVSAVMVLSGRSLNLRLLRRPTKLEKSREPEAEPHKAEAKEETVLPSVVFRLDYLKGLDDARTCVRETYWETRHILAISSQDAGARSETHREYETRIRGRLADAASSFSVLTRLFELAEYSQHSLSLVEADEAINHAVLIAEGMNAEVKK